MVSSNLPAGMQLRPSVHGDKTIDVFVITCGHHNTNLNAANGADFCSLQQGFVKSWLVERRPLQNLFQQLNDIELHTAWYAATCAWEHWTTLVCHNTELHSAHTHSSSMATYNVDCIWQLAPWFSAVCSEPEHALGTRPDLSHPPWHCPLSLPQTSICHVLSTFIVYHLSLCFPTTSLTATMPIILQVLYFSSFHI